MRLVEEFCRRLYPGSLAWGSPSAGWPFSLADAFEVRSTLASVPAGATITPLSVDTLHASAALLQRTTLYSDMSVVVLPVDVESMYLSYSLSDTLRRGPEYDAVVTANLRYPELVRKGRCLFLPRSYTHKEESMSEWSMGEFTAPVLQTSDQLTFTPANAAPTRLGRSPFVDMAVFERLVLPYFPQASLLDVVSIAEHETDQFVRFGHYLNRKLRDIGQAATEERLEDLMDEIRDSVTDLERKAQKIRKSTALCNFQIGYFGVAIGLLFGPVEIAHVVAAITGAVNLTQIAVNSINIQRDRLDLESTDLYVPYLLDNPNKIK